MNELEDRCPHCDAILRDPPECCEKMINEHLQSLNEALRELNEKDYSRDA